MKSIKIWTVGRFLLLSAFLWLVCCDGDVLPSGGSAALLVKNQSDKTFNRISVSKLINAEKHEYKNVAEIKFNFTSGSSKTISGFNEGSYDVVVGDNLILTVYLKDGQTTTVTVVKRSGNWGDYYELVEE